MTDEFTEIKEAAAQAEREDAENAAKLDVLDVVAPEPDDGPYKPHKLSFARRLILGRAANELAPGEDVVPDEDALMLCVYVCHEADAMRLHQLVQQPRQLIAAAVAFADEVEPEDYAVMAEFASTQMARLAAAEEIGGTKTGGADEDDGPAEKNSESGKV